MVCISSFEISPFFLEFFFMVKKAAKYEKNDKEVRQECVEEGDEDNEEDEEVEDEEDEGKGKIMLEECHCIKLYIA